MVTLGSIQPATFQAFHGSAQGYDDTLNFQSLQLSLNDVASMPSSSGSTCFHRSSTTVVGDHASEHPAPAPASRRGSVSSMSVPDQETGVPQESLAGRSTSETHSVYTASSASHKLFRAAKPETSRSSSWQPSHPSLDRDRGLGIDSSNGGDSSSSSASWRTTVDSSSGVVSKPPGLALPQQNNGGVGRFGARSPVRTARRGSREDKRSQNEILDGSDVLQQISNLTSTEPSNEREVFVGGLRESEDAVHITEEELATYFSKFGVIESVSINRDDRTHRGRGFAFVKFFQESAALNAVVADASTHVIRGTTVSVQWSRGAKDGGGDRPRRRGSNTSATSSGSPSRGNSRSSPKMGMFSSVGGQKGGGGHRGGGSGVGSNGCGAGCSHCYSPRRSRVHGHMHAGSLGSVPTSYPYSDHHNQPMVCVVVPAQRAAALGLAHHPAHPLPSTGSRGSPPGDVHFIPLASAGNGHSGSGYPSHTRSHSHTPSSSSGGGGGGYGHYGAHEHHSHAINVPHHHSVGSQKSSSSSVSAHSSSYSYGGHGGGHGHGHAHAAPPHFPPAHHRSHHHHHHQSSTSNHQRSRGRVEPRSYPSAHGSVGMGGMNSQPQQSSSSYATDYERPQHSHAFSHSNSYPPQGWSGDGPGSGSMHHAVLRSQSPPTLMSAAPQRGSGGGASRPPPTPPRGYESQYKRYNAPGPVHGTALDGFSAGKSATGRRHSGSSVTPPSRVSGGGGSSSSISSSFYLSPTAAADLGSEHDYERDYGYADPSRLS